MWIYHICVFISWWALDRHLGPFYFLACMNNVVLNIHVCALFLRVELLGHSAALCLTSEELPNFFTKWLRQFAFLPAVYEGSNVPLPSVILDTCLFDHSHPHICKMAFHGGFICICLTTNDVEYPYIRLLAICTSSLEKCLFRSFGHFYIVIFFSLLCCKSYFF